jgi:integrase
MASVHRDPRNRSPYWYAAYTLPDGTRCLKSTKLRERSKALKLAMEWEHLARFVAERDPTGAQIARVNADIYERTTGQPVEVVYLGDFLRSWAERASSLKSKRTGEKYRQVAEDFLNHIGPARAKSSIGSIREADVRSFLEKEAKDGKYATTVANVAKVLRIPFNLALRQGLILRHPVSSMDIPDANSRQKKAFTWPEVLKLISVAEGDWITAVMLGAYCGMRIGDCVKLKWENVNLDEDVIQFIPEKTSTGKRRKELTVPIHSTLRIHLETLRQKSTEDQIYICPTLHDKSIGGRSGLSNYFCDFVMPKAEIASRKEQIQTTGKGRAFRSLSFHSLRHSFNSELANRGVSQELRRNMTGHTTDKMNDIYSHLDKNLLRGAVNKLPGRNSAQPKKATQG